MKFMALLAALLLTLVTIGCGDTAPEEAPCVDMQAGFYKRQLVKVASTCDGAFRDNVNDLVGIPAGESILECSTKEVVDEGRSSAGCTHRTVATTHVTADGISGEMTRTETCTDSGGKKNVCEVTYEIVLTPLSGS